jgi:predicted metal-binding membrane protein
MSGVAIQGGVGASAAVTAAPQSLVRAVLRDRGALVAGIALLVLAAAAWVAVVMQSSGMEGAMLPAAPSSVPVFVPVYGSLADIGMFALMWGVMMAAMMLPSAIPMIALYGLVSRDKRAVPVAVFAATYLLVWLVLGLPVYAGSVAVGALGEIGAASWLPYALAVVLAAAGAYQFSAIKRVCLRNCQTPIGFLMQRWRDGYASTFRLGLSHAAYCVGCCWGLMVILVAAGAMSLPWVLGIAAIVFAEKLLPRGEWTARVVGVVLVVTGVAVALRPELALTLRGHPAGAAGPMPM